MSFSIDEHFIEKLCDYLESAGLKPDNKTTYVKLNCPDCGKPECFCYPTAGYYSLIICSHKKHCGYRKTLKDYLNISFPENKDFSEEAEYFRKHGLNMKALMESGILDYESPVIKLRKVEDKEYKMYLQKVTLERDGKQVEKFRWFHEPGWKAEYGEYMPVLCGFKHDRLLVLEGIWNWLLGITFGLPCTCSLFGAAYIPQFDVGFKVFQTYKYIDICYDVDRAGQEGTNKLAIFLHEKYPDKKINAIRLPFKEDEPYKDFCEWIVDCQHTVKEFSDIGPVKIDAKETKLEQKRSNVIQMAQQAELHRPEINNVIKRISDTNNNINYIVSSTGIYIEKHVVQMGQEFTIFNKICDDPIIIDSRLDDVFTHDSYVKLSWGNRSEIVPYNWLWIKYMEQLSDKGLRINAANAKPISTYFLAALGEHQEVVDVATKNGWCDLPKGANTGFIAGDRIFKYNDYDPIVEDMPRISNVEVSKRGDKETWLRIVRSMCDKDPQTAIVMGAGTACPLIKLLNMDNFVVHIFGESSTGKSLSQKAAATVWGKHQLMVKEWKATQTGHELYFEEMQNIPCFLQDSQEVVDDSLISTVCYMFANGQGKGRGMAQAGGKIKGAPHKYWKTILISSGEKRITEVSTQGGLMRRTLELYRDIDMEKNHAKFLEINEVLNNNYGHGAEDVINYIIENRDSFSNHHKENVAVLSGMLYDKIISPVQAAHIPYWALIWIGLQMNKELFHIDYDDDALMHQIDMTFFSFNKNPVDNLYSTIMEIFISNKNKFLVRDVNKASGGVITSPTQEGETWGLYNKEKNVIYFFPKVLRRELKKYGFVWSMLEFLIKHGKVEISPMTRKMEQKISIEGIKVSAIGFPIEIAEP